uniref:NR LBD domain-containing protein n=1 Tax=Wuchereria bancrofti TaxID=6293 RepID=A0AAF5RU14_WUCBA
MLILDARCACRACRLKKCEEMGMDRKVVQLKRLHETYQKSMIKINSRRMATNSTEFINNPLSTISNNDRSEMRRDDPSVSSYDYDVSSVSQEKGLIACLVDDYKKQRERRRMMLCQCVEEIIVDETESEGMLKGPASTLDYVDIFKVQVVLMHEWVLRLEEFNAIEDPFDKSKLLRRFTLRYMLLDNIFHAVELGVRDRIILVNNTYIIPGNFPNNMPDETEISQTIKRMMYGERSAQLIDELIAPMVDMNFTIGEFMALRLITFWNPYGVTFSPQTKKTIEMARNRAVNELYRWYSDQHFESIDIRLGNLLLLLCPITEQLHYMTEIVKLIPSFGTLNERDSYLQNILAT